MSRELTALDSVLEIERQVHEQETNLKAQLQKAERRKKASLHYAHNAIGVFYSAYVCFSYPRHALSKRG